MRSVDAVVNRHAAVAADPALSQLRVELLEQL
jgi:hypothetical protein